MYWAMDVSGNKYFPRFTVGAMTDNELENSLYWEDGSEEPTTFEIVRTYYESIITEADNGGYTPEEAAEYKAYKDVYDFYRNDSVNDFVCPLYPHEVTDKVTGKILALCKRNGWKSPADYTDAEILRDLLADYGEEPAPDFISDGAQNPGWAAPFYDILESFWDPDGGECQELWGE